MIKMKKYYVTPEVSEIEIEMMRVIADSMEQGGELE